MIVLTIESEDATELARELNTLIGALGASAPAQAKAPVVKLVKAEPAPPAPEAEAATDTFSGLEDAYDDIDPRDSAGMPWVKGFHSEGAGGSKPILKATGLYRMRRNMTVVDAKAAMAEAEMGSVEVTKVLLRYGLTTPDAAPPPPPPPAAAAAEAPPPPAAAAGAPPPAAPGPEVSFIELMEHIANTDGLTDPIVSEALKSIGHTNIIAISGDPVALQRMAGLLGMGA